MATTTRRRFLASGIALLVAPLAAEAQPKDRVPRLGFLMMARNPGVESRFPQGLRDLGYVEGRDVVIEYRDAQGDTSRLPALADELVRLGVNVLIAAGSEVLDAAMKATATIPIVVVGSSDPVAEGWAASLGRPGGNATGLTVVMPGFATKRLQLLREVVAELSRLAVLRAPSSGTGPLALQTTARALGITVHILDVQYQGDIKRALDEAVRRRSQALDVGEVAFLFAHRATIAGLATQRRLPTIGLFRQSAEAGYLVTYGVDLGDLQRRAAGYVDKILRGAKPADLPIEQPTKFDLVINLKTAKALGLTIPPSLLLRADQVVE